MITEAANDAKYLARAALRAVIWGSVTAFFAAVAVFFLTGALFVWISASYGTFVAFLCIGGLFLLATVASATALAINNARLRERTQHLAIAKPATWLDPTIIVTALDIARLIGGRRGSLALAGASLAFWLLKRPSNARSSSRQSRSAAGNGRYSGEQRA